jgi:hypothetical protein
MLQAMSCATWVKQSCEGRRHTAPCKRPSKDLHLPLVQEVVRRVPLLPRLFYRLLLGKHQLNDKGKHLLSDKDNLLELL